AHGRYFARGSAQCITARASLLLINSAVRLEDDDGALLSTIALSDIKVSARLGSLPRKLYLPDGGCFETADNDAIDQILRQSGHDKHASWLHRMEMSWRMVSVAVAGTGILIAFMALVGVPWLALQLAKYTPPSVARSVTEQTLAALDKLGALKPTTLDPERVAALQQRLAHVTAAMPPAPGTYQLILKDAPTLGPNAFALPDGRIIMTDQLVALAQSDDELEGVLGHEASHVIHAHALQRTYQASIIPVMITFVSGDVSSLSHTAALLPGVLLQSNYSKTFEQQADDDSALALKRVGIEPSHLADILERIEKKYCGDQGCGANWLGTHPDTEVRAAHLREASTPLQATKRAARLRED
ncbi:MAG: M48 family metallopeptidase, partial [Pseudomonadales bacterium]|nr:M48 family metallopeptidase [Pseudomonadales bacterium]